MSRRHYQKSSLYTAHRPSLAFAKLEAEYTRLRDARVGHDEVVAKLGLTDTAAEKFRTYWNVQRRTPDMTGVHPAFARCDEYVGAVMASGGFPRFSERRGPRGHVAVVPPLLYPEVA